MGDGGLGDIENFRQFGDVARLLSDKIEQHQAFGIAHAFADVVVEQLDFFVEIVGVISEIFCEIVILFIFKYRNVSI